MPSITFTAMGSSSSDMAYRQHSFSAARKPRRALRPCLAPLVHDGDRGWSESLAGRALKQRVGVAVDEGQIVINGVDRKGFDLVVHVVQRVQEIVGGIHRQRRGFSVGHRRSKP